MNVVKLLRLQNVPILRQLLLEEALLRADSSNWCIVNDGTAVPAIVMGISGKPHELINIPAAKKDGIQVIKRFSGGGTVVTDEDTIFATLIMQSAAIPDVELYPRPLMRWSERLYAHVFNQYGQFSLQENDYCFGDVKFGGNAQAITKQRFLHHTSMLWDFQKERMQLLSHPANIPDYRAARDHLDFVCKLKDYAHDRQQLLDSIPAALLKAGFDVQEAQLEQAEGSLAKNYFKNTKVVDLASSKQLVVDANPSSGNIAPGRQRTQQS